MCLADILGPHSVTDPPGSKNVANWQTHFFSRHNSPCETGLWIKLSLPTVANSPGKLANSMATFAGAHASETKDCWTRVALWPGTAFSLSQAYAITACM